MRRAFVEVSSQHVPEHAYAEQWDVAGLQGRIEARARCRICRSMRGPRRGYRRRGLLSRIESRVDEHMAAKWAQWARRDGATSKNHPVETLDILWREHW